MSPNAQLSDLSVTLLVVVFTILGGWLLYIGRRRRVGGDPHCRKCNYILHGLSSDRCPECGSLLSPASIVYGEPQRRWKTFLAGWLVLLPLGIFISIGGVSQLQDVDWYHYKPTYFVLRDLNSGRAPDQQRAWTELMRRDADKSLSANTRDALVRFALVRQAHAAQPTNSLDIDTINYLGGRCLAKDLPADQLTKFFQQSIRTKLAVRNTVVFGDWVPYLTIHDGLGPTQGGFWTRLSSGGLQLDGRKIDGPSGGSASYSGFGAGSWGTSTKCPPPGKHELTVTVHIEIFNGSMNGPGTITLEYQCDRTMTGSFEVVATKPANLIQPVFDPKLAAAMKAAVTLQAFRYSLKDHMFDGMIRFNNPPMNLAYDVIARYGGKEHPLGEVTYHFPAGTGGYSTSGSVPDPPPATVDVILRPSEKAAVDTVDIYSYWNQEMVFPNVPVARR
ncbi:MAG: hypothetical protein ABSB42_16795 [Tepidisphaeraceae bacterium]